MNDDDDLGDWVLVGDVARGVFAAFKRENWTREGAASDAGRGAPLASARAIDREEPTAGELIQSIPLKPA